MNKHRIKEARAKYGYSQKDLGDIIGASRQTINLIESGNYNPGINLCLKISKALGESLEDLFKDQEFSG